MDTEPERGELGLCPRNCNGEVLLNDCLAVLHFNLTEVDF